MTSSRMTEIQARLDDCRSYNFGMWAAADQLVHVDVPYLLSELRAAQERIDKALACYGPDPKLRLGESRWRTADEFLIAIRAALTDEETE